MQNVTTYQEDARKHQSRAWGSFESALGKHKGECKLRNSEASLHGAGGGGAYRLSAFSPWAGGHSWLTYPFMHPRSVPEGLSGLHYHLLLGPRVPEG